MKDSLKRNWWKLLRGNENVNKLRSFVDFGVPLNYNFEVRTFPISAAQIVANGGRWECPSKAVEFLGSAEVWPHVSSGRQEREASLLHSLSLDVQRIKPRPSIQPIIKFIFSPHFVGLTSQAMRQSETSFFYPISKQNKNPGFSHVESGNRDSSRFSLKNRDIPIKSG